ncbi:MAG: DMT family transporter [Pseudomonadota bacterium]
MNAQSKSNLRGALFALLAFGLFSTHDVIVKVLGSSYAPFQIVFFSVLLSFPLVMLMLMRDSTRGTLIPAHPWWTAARTIAVIITATCAFYAFSVLPLAEVYAILFAMPLMITILSIPVLGERVGLHRWGAVIVGLCGVLVVLRPGTASLSLGHLSALMAAVGGAVASIIVRRIGKDERNAVLLLYPMMANFVIMGALMPVYYNPMPALDLGLLAIMAILAFSGTLCVIQAYKAGDAALVAPMQYSQILWAAGFGAIFFSESIDPMTGLGAAIIILSGVYVVIREAIGGRSDNRPVLETRSRPETGTTPRVGAVLMRNAAASAPSHESLAKKS